MLSSGSSSPSTTSTVAPTTVSPAINQATQAVNFLNQSDIPDFNNAALAADTAAGQFGMKVCNYGH